MRADSIVPIAPGSTTLEVDLGGRMGFVAVAVSALFANDTLALTAGQFRNWMLDSGRYALTVVAVSPPQELRWLEMVTDGARCLRNLRSEDTIHCVVYERGAVAVRNIGTNAASPARRAYVRIVRTP